MIEVLSNPAYRTKAMKIGAALSPWKEMKDPVGRAVWWVEQVTDNPGVWTIKDFYQKYPVSIQGK